MYNINSKFRFVSFWAEWRIFYIRSDMAQESISDIKKVFIPIDNSIDLEEIPKEITKKWDIVLVKDYLDIYYYLFSKEKK